MLTDQQQLRQWAAEIAIPYAGDDMRKLAEIADGLIAYVTKHSLGHVSNKWTGEMEQQAADYRRSGKKPSEIAVILNERFGTKLSFRAVKQKLRAMNVESGASMSPGQRRGLQLMQDARAAKLGKAA
jgi:hypothetical protein